jgi:predicted DNA-binding transcriptional regulator AlpA
VSKHKHKSKKYLRKRAVAERYSVDARTVDRMALDGRLPAPIYLTRFPLWDEEELDASDRRAALLPRPAHASAA